jgi:hypothetical protein
LSSRQGWFITIAPLDLALTALLHRMKALSALAEGLDCTVNPIPPSLALAEAAAVSVAVAVVVVVSEAVVVVVVVSLAVGKAMCRWSEVERRPSPVRKA